MPLAVCIAPHAVTCSPCGAAIPALSVYVHETRTRPKRRVCVCLSCVRSRIERRRELASEGAA